MKRQQETTSSLRSSSSRRCDSVSPATNQTGRRHVKAANVGCMSGIFQFVSKYHTRRKFLTFGRRQEKQPPPTSSTTTPNSKTPKPEPITCPSRDHPSPGRISLETPRSPAITPEIRTSGSPRVVARVMGLPGDPPPAATPPPESAAEKRRKLLGALEKCDEDLKALKRIIEAVREAQTPPQGGAVSAKCVEEREEEEEREYETGSEGPSPVSVLDHHQPLDRSPATGFYKRTRNGKFVQHHKQKQKQERQEIIVTMKLKPWEEDHNTSIRFQQAFYLPTRTRQPPPPLTTTTRRASSPLWSKAMRESVDEVCRDVEWGNRREVGIVALLIQDFIFRDLIEEFTKEMGGCHEAYSSKRKLCF